ncbi:MAG: porin family protein [Dysgonamonadaceae bacterium]|jgi:hypothetical protein|nr:porin family protein [Dysgonamonadaceae bacterium]MDD3309256.1 porin family protein [Dysgonamonadaceae bacterium]MDD3899638.1 porin family protein [Dysgonamonadaceae bacterium]MDD4398151.1 porin family protein [Dysgonamonadaceae bacterium]MEA5081860.1 porin family protein [Dysgonamonadaceae bacterium]
MKKLKFTLIVLMIAFAGAASAQVSLGVKGGVNMSNFYGDEVTQNNPKVGFNAGIAADFALHPDMSIQSGLFFTTKGFKFDSNVLDFSENLMYLQIPVHFAYKVTVTPGTRIFFHGGPYVAYGVGGKTKVDLGELGNASDDVFGDGVGQYKRFDTGLGIGVGTEFGPFLVDLGWDMGLLNISNATNGNVKNQNAYLSVGYMF